MRVSELRWYPFTAVEFAPRVFRDFPRACTRSASTAALVDAPLVDARGSHAIPPDAPGDAYAERGGQRAGEGRTG